MSNFVAIDFETANNSRASACAVGLVTVSDGRVVEENMFLIKPPSSSFIFTYIHGLAWDDVKNEPAFDELWPEINEVIKDADFLAAHNAPFDKGVLNTCCQEYNIQTPATPFVCTVKLARSHWGFNPAKLNNVCDSLDIPLNHHEALSDARACANIIIRAQSEGWSHR